MNEEAASALSVEPSIAPSEDQKAEAQRLFAGRTTRHELMKMYGMSESTTKRGDSHEVVTPHIHLKLRQS